MSDRYTPDRIAAVATDAAFAGGFLHDVAARVGALVAASGEFIEQAGAAWSGPRADNDLGITTELRVAIAAGFADALDGLAALLDELSDAGVEYARELRTHVYWRDVYGAQHRAHARGDWARCRCPVDDTSGDPGAADRLHGQLWHEAQSLVDTTCRHWRELLERFAALAPPLVEAVLAACAAPAISGEFSRPVVSGAALAAVVLAHRPSTQLPAELFGLGIDDVVAYYVAGGDPEALSGAELGAALAPLDNEALAVTWTALPLAQRLALVGVRPDVAARVLPQLTARELLALREAVAHPVFTTEFADHFELELGVRVAAVDIGVAIGSANEVVVAKQSDGRVLVGVGFEERFGLFVETAAPGDEAHLGVGMLAFAENLYRFDCEQDAAAAIDRLRDAADRTPSEAFVELFTGNELERVMADLGGTNLLSEMEGAGGYVDVALTVERLAAAGVELDLSASAYSRTEYVAPGSGEFVAVQGVMVAGAIAATVRRDGRPSAPGAAPRGVGASGAFVVDAHTHTSGDGVRRSFVTVTVTGGVAGMIGAELAGNVPVLGGPVTTTTGAERGEVAAIEITLPVDPGTSPLEIARQVATLDYFDALDSAQLAAADITVTHDAVATTRSEIGVDAGPIEASATASERTLTNVVTIHKPPDGVPYSQTELDRELERELARLGLARPEELQVSTRCP